ncbi:hypothetical protein BC828DRAFT_387633 [Blastocladiella britannica]|nr:hypothetical protein BC828DRAFT_387633 [Blastocladiella britannica]
MPIPAAVSPTPGRPPTPPPSIADVSSSGGYQDLARLLAPPPPPAPTQRPQRSPKLPHAASRLHLWRSAPPPAPPIRTESSSVLLSAPVDSSSFAKYLTPHRATSPLPTSTATGTAISSSAIASSSPGLGHYNVSPKGHNGGALMQQPPTLIDGSTGGYPALSPARRSSRLMGTGPNSSSNGGTASRHALASAAAALFPHQHQQHQNQYPEHNGMAADMDRRRGGSSSVVPAADRTSPPAALSPSIPSSSTGISAARDGIVVHDESAWTALPRAVAPWLTLVLVSIDATLSVGLVVFLLLFQARPLPTGLWATIAPVADVALLNLVRASVWAALLMRINVPFSPTHVSILTAIYAAGKTMSLFTMASPEPSSPSSSFALLYSTFSLVMPAAETIHAKLLLRPRAQPLASPPPTVATLTPGASVASRRTARRAPVYAAFTPTDAASQPLLGDGDGPARRDYHTFLGAPVPNRASISSNGLIGGSAMLGRSDRMIGEHRPNSFGGEAHQAQDPVVGSRPWQHHHQHQQHPSHYHRRSGATAAVAWGLGTEHSAPSTTASDRAARWSLATFDADHLAQLQLARTRSEESPSAAAAAGGGGDSAAAAGMMGAPAFFHRRAATDGLTDGHGTDSALDRGSRVGTSSTTTQPNGPTGDADGIDASLDDHGDDGDATLGAAENVPSFHLRSASHNDVASMAPRNGWEVAVVEMATTPHGSSSDAPAIVASSPLSDDHHQPQHQNESPVPLPKKRHSPHGLMPLLIHADDTSGRDADASSNASSSSPPPPTSSHAPTPYRSRSGTASPGGTSQHMVGGPVSGVGTGPSSTNATAAASIAGSAPGTPIVSSAAYAAFPYLAGAVAASAVAPLLRASHSTTSLFGGSNGGGPLRTASAGNPGGRAGFAPRGRHQRQPSMPSNTEASVVGTTTDDDSDLRHLHQHHRRQRGSPEDSVSDIMSLLPGEAGQTDDSVNNEMDDDGLGSEHGGGIGDDDLAHSVRDSATIYSTLSAHLYRPATPYDELEASGVGGGPYGGSDSDSDDGRSTPMPSRGQLSEPGGTTAIAATPVVSIDALPLPRSRSNASLGQRSARSSSSASAVSAAIERWRGSVLLASQSSLPGSDDAAAHDADLAGSDTYDDADDDDYDDNTEEAYSSQAAAAVATLCAQPNLERGDSRAAAEMQPAADILARPLWQKLYSAEAQLIDRTVVQGANDFDPAPIAYQFAQLASAASGERGSDQCTTAKEAIDLEHLLVLCEMWMAALAPTKSDLAVHWWRASRIMNHCMLLARAASPQLCTTGLNGTARLLDLVHNVLILPVAVAAAEDSRSLAESIAEDPVWCLRARLIHQLAAMRN